MFFPLFASLILSATATSVNPGVIEAPAGEAPTHTLQLSAKTTGCLLIDGVPSEETTIELASAHIATRVTEDGELSTVQLPSGQTYYKGDFTLRVQSATMGTIDIQLCDGQAVLDLIDETTTNTGR